MEILCGNGGPRKIKEAITIRSPLVTLSKSWQTPLYPLKPCVSFRPCPMSKADFGDHYYRTCCSDAVNLIMQHENLTSVTLCKYRGHSPPAFPPWWCHYQGDGRMIEHDHHHILDPSFEWEEEDWPKLKWRPRALSLIMFGSLARRRKEGNFLLHFITIRSVDGPLTLPSFQPPPNTTSAQKGAPQTWILQSK